MSDDAQLGDFIEDNTTLAPLDAALHASMHNVIKEVLDSLTTRGARSVSVPATCQVAQPLSLTAADRTSDGARRNMEKVCDFFHRIASLGQSRQPLQGQSRGGVTVPQLAHGSSIGPSTRGTK
jgi:hypothetical protein